MDDLLLSPCSSFSPPSPPSFFSNAGHPIIEFASCEVPEQWLLGDVVVAKNESYNDVDELWPVGSTLYLEPAELSSQPPPPPPPELAPPPPESRSVVTVPAAQHPGKRRGSKPGPHRPEGPIVSHTEAERQRREKLNRRFCELRAAVPTVSRMDKASLLADAVAYIAELRARVARLEAESKRAAAARWPEPMVVSRGGPQGAAAAAETVEVRMLGPYAASVRATSAAPHAAARLMGALRSLELHVQLACVTRVHGVTVQEVVVDVPAQLQDDGDGLRAALLQMLL
ncbi:unnamed protein product [Urochloa decumbens]|uniref:Transcription factor n=1 Tax=Urochloa decumbens TaxID=240449 RepID=A0ABC9FCP7_9POAL